MESKHIIINNNDVFYGLQENVTDGYSIRLSIPKLVELLEKKSMNQYIKSKIVMIPRVNTKLIRLYNKNLYEVKYNFKNIINDIVINNPDKSCTIVLAIGEMYSPYVINFGLMNGVKFEIWTWDNVNTSQYKKFQNNFSIDSIKFYSFNKYINQISYLSNDNPKPSISPILITPPVHNHPKPYDSWSNLSKIYDRNNNPEPFCLKTIPDLDYINKYNLNELDIPSFITIREQNNKFMEFMLKNKICICTKFCNDSECKSITFDRMLNI